MQDTQSAATISQLMITLSQMLALSCEVDSILWNLPDSFFQSAPGQGPTEASRLMLLGQISLVQEKLKTSTHCLDTIPLKSTKPQPSKSDASAAPSPAPSVKPDTRPSGPKVCPWCEAGSGGYTSHSQNCPYRTPSGTGISPTPLGMRW